MMSPNISLDILRVLLIFCVISIWKSFMRIRVLFFQKVFWLYLEISANEENFHKHFFGCLSRISLGISFWDHNIQELIPRSFHEIWKKAFKGTFPQSIKNREVYLPTLTYLSTPGIISHIPSGITSEMYWGLLLQNSFCRNSSIEI